MIRVPSVILERLKATTATVHSSLEQRLRIALPAPSLTDYRSYLRAMHGFVAPLEATFRAMAELLPAELELEQRYKTALLRADLTALAARAGACDTPICNALPPTNDPAAALGALYVLEGSTLGARWLLRHLEPIEIEPASSYLRGYGDALGPMWQKMRATLASYHAENPGQAVALLAAAVQTFERLDDWLVQCQAAEARRAS
jgi:heme oxygenase